jgi:glycosyltransferase involved in cell wall biosynthesis
VSGRSRADAPGDAAREVTIVAHDIGAVGGMERQIEELLVGLRALGYRITVIARTCELASLEGIAFHRVRAPRRPFVLAYPWFMLTGSLALARRRRGVVQATGAIVLNRVDAIAVHYLHQVGPVNPSRSARVFHLQVKAAGVLKRLAERLCYRPGRAAAFVCVSEGVADEVRAHYPAIAAQVLTIHNGVDTRAFAPVGRARREALRAQLAIPSDQLLAAFVGSEWERKGLEPAIRALDSRPEWSIAIAGAGDRARFAAIAAEVGAGGRVRWLGVRSDVEHVYQLADAFILPSSYESFSLVTFEAAAAGLPILATPVNGVRELIADARNGYLITRDPELIAERLGRLARDPELRQRLGAAARESALGFSWQRMVAAHDALYARLAAR